MVKMSFVVLYLELFTFIHFTQFLSRNYHVLRYTLYDKSFYFTQIYQKCLGNVL